MHYTLTHTTRYRYDRPVFLEPHIIRLRPRSDGSQRLIRFDWNIEPRPAGVTDQLDVENNVTLNAWFSEPTDHLTIITSFEVETLRENPFQFVLDSSVEFLPLNYPLYRFPGLGPYVQRRSAYHPRLTELNQKLHGEAGGRTLPFLMALNTWLNREVEQIIREEGDPQAPGITLEAGRGSCRDLTVVFMEICRIQGIAARFVSGYQEGAEDQGERYLHAWAEVYLPGAGWMGFDPTLGLVVADRHIPAAASVIPAGAAPVYGSFRGTDAQSTMSAVIELATG